MNIVKKIAAFFGRSSSPKDNSIIYPAEVSPMQLAAFTAEHRMITVMKTGDAGEAKYCEFIKWCIEHDPDQNVRSAALKRLPNFKEQINLVRFLQHLDQSHNKTALEPYLTMALSRIGLITDYSYCCYNFANV